MRERPLPPLHEWRTEQEWLAIIQKKDEVIRLLREQIDSLQDRSDDLLMEE